ncbi:DUF1573 domain-containing protein [Hymenobacter sp. J193]|uniref:DUF1573 domain-containing protein n=1 Tax=Hymenobacter sp. J193 TaxID=2898429 RepID=UPI0021510057|nr:DUF1573 domain-containing protein [Hymenobacter sp. J193]MCR5888026.1 DUF1573 domain-containing protein [Hymenobacter sp. J193]
MKRTLFSALLLSAGLFVGACNRDKASADGTEGMNAAATAAADVANPTVDNPNATEESETPNPNAPVMTFTETEFDFGDIKPGAVVNHTFSFTNTGKSPLLISNAQASCGCTTPNWTKDPIQPGGKGTIEVQFNSQGKSGVQHKEISIQANTQPSVNKIAIKTNILPDGTAGPVRQ